MIAFWWVWRSLHIGERLLLAASLISMAFCAGASWRKYFQRPSPKVILRESSQTKLIQWDSGASIIVDVSGAVRRPGVVQLASGSRVEQAIEKAGGVLPSANVSTLNLAATLRDGEQILVESATSKSTFIERDTADHKININRASETELQSLPDIGPVMAARIVAYRNSHGDFENIDDLNAVKGIGVKTIQQLRPYIVFH